MMIVRLKIILLLILFTSNLFSQTQSEAIKKQAQNLMNEGRYAEAVDQLNKFISFNPQLAEGYHLRGLCYEQMIQYQYAVLDLRRALRLDPANLVISKDLNRVISYWHQQLYQKIEGHKRDIAINPDYPFYYLEIGKSYRWLEEWQNAEYWYDEYLKRDDNASPDEIIRYTEILAKTGSISKGEKILKKYVERYPDDWRLWSRYGYFTLWLGKYKIAEDAFKRALEIKPYFKEAQDGLDLAQNKAYLRLNQPRSFERVYPIDRYYSIINRYPENDSIRFLLAQDLIKANRYEEAYQQLTLLQNKYYDNEKFQKLYNLVTNYRDSTNNSNIAYFTEILKNNPGDKNAALKLAEAYANLIKYDDAIEVLSEYLSDKPEDAELDVRFAYARYCAWNYEWERAIAQLDKLIEFDPDNTDYKVLRAQIAVWTVLDLDLAEKYLLEIIEKKPQELQAYLSLVSLYSWKKNFEEAKKYLEIAKQLAPNSQLVASVESTYELHLSAYEELKALEIRGEAQILYSEGKCEEARTKYEEYFKKKEEPTREEYAEYAGILACGGDKKEALTIYDRLLNEKFDPNDKLDFRICVERIKIYHELGDKSAIQQEIEKIATIEIPDTQILLLKADAFAAAGYFQKSDSIYSEIQSQTDDPATKKEIDQKYILMAGYMTKLGQLDEAEDVIEELESRIDDNDLLKQVRYQKMFLGDAYAERNEWGAAEDIYEELVEEFDDSSNISLVKQRLSWIPPYGIEKGFISVRNFVSRLFPTNINITPYTTMYIDNFDLDYFNYGTRVEGGFLGFFGLGAQWQRAEFKSDSKAKHLTGLKLVASIFPLKNLVLAGGKGALNISSEPSRDIWDFMIRYELIDTFTTTFSFERNDARLILLSPLLIPFSLNTDIYRFNSSYNYKHSLYLSLFYNYLEVSDGNIGNDIQIRIGKRFFTFNTLVSNEREKGSGVLGYEYYFADYGFKTQFYFTPQNYVSHSLWADFILEKSDYLTLKTGGKIGYLPFLDFIVSELYADAVYKPFEYFFISGRISYANSYRYDTGYKAFSAYLSLFWNIN
ncbi:tetratricopeptide repeat protein [Melioribacter sp. OK-6-Me]|uniref:tetratricopeptide repeat protein n=1 Tax=unclassified Melioribacter TaxID=2627329 RepID=UPI003ED8B1F4